MQTKVKLTAAALSLLSAFTFLTGCSTESVTEDAEKEIESAEDSGTSQKADSDEMIQYTVQADADTTSVVNGSLEYVPFSAAEKSQIGKKIGSVRFSEDDPEEVVFEVVEQPSDQWIIVSDADQNEPVIYREISVTEYPEGFTSEYAWN